MQYLVVAISLRNVIPFPSGAAVSLRGDRLLGIRLVFRFLDSAVRPTAVKGVI